MPNPFSQLGHKSILTNAQIADPRKILDTFPNPTPKRNYQIEFIFPEFTSVCPITAQPDFATITIQYIPNKLCVEMKSLKLYFLAFRNKGIFYEAVTNQILDDLLAILKPRQIKITATFAPRGGTSAIITAQHPQNPMARGVI